jgi:hypothetical protein
MTGYFLFILNFSSDFDLSNHLSLVWFSCMTKRIHVHICCFLSTIDKTLKICSTKEQILFLLAECSALANRDYVEKVNFICYSTKSYNLSIWSQNEDTCESNDLHQTNP